MITFVQPHFPARFLKEIHVWRMESSKTKYHCWWRLESCAGTCGKFLLALPGRPKWLKPEKARGLPFPPITPNPNIDIIILTGAKAA